MKASLEYVQPGIGSLDAAVSGGPREHALPKSLAEIYDEHFDFVWRNARRMGVLDASADDVAQDVFLIVQRRLPTYDGRAPMQAWIFGILVRVVSSHMRAFRRKGARNVSLDQDSEASRSVSSPLDETPFAQLERVERARILSRLLEQLDEDKRALLILSELEEWTLREIAELYHSNINTIYSRLRAAKRDFERAYQQAQAGQSGKGGSR